MSQAMPNPNQPTPPGGGSGPVRKPPASVPITRIPTSGSQPKPGGNGTPQPQIHRPAAQQPPESPKPAAPQQPAVPQSTPAPSAPRGLPPISELKGRPLGRVLQKMGRVTGEQYTEASTIKNKKGARSAESSSTWDSSKMPISTSPWPRSKGLS